MFVNWDKNVRVVADLIANAAPDAFAGPVVEIEPVGFDLETDFSEYERGQYLALAGSILEALRDTGFSAATRLGSAPHMAC